MYKLYQRTSYAKIKEFLECYAVQCALENRNDYLEKLKDLK